MLRQAKTENGLVEGLQGTNSRITVYKGIPFAAPPVGENRWRATKPHEDWEGVRKCYKFAPISVQDTPGLSDDLYCNEFHVDSDIAIDEDCLYLNIWTPATSENDNLPVLVWYFGGAFQWGYTAEMEFDGEHLAKQEIIVVSVNYRLGALGFMCHPELTANQPEGFANFGHLDQQAGLKWVKRNIKAFGGNPEQITIAGQSAGGASTLTQLCIRDNFEDISGAVIISGMIRDPYTKDELMLPQNLAKAEANGVEFLDFLGIKSIDEARRLDAFYIREKYAEYRENHPWMSTVIDGKNITDDPYEMYLKGEHAPVPVMSGNTTEEFPLSTDPEISTVEPSVKGAFMADELKPRHKDHYYYRFDADIPGDDNPGCFHSVDLWFFFDNVDKCIREYRPAHFELAKCMSEYFTNFVKCGNPNGLESDAKKMPLWKPYSAFERNEMEFSLGGPKATLETSEKVHKVARDTAHINQGLNPYLPSWEYIPDGEPYVFGDRVYVYGSHDRFGGEVFCLNDYVCWSAPIDDLSDWRYEGVTYKATDDPLNKDRRMVLYAPDVTIGPDGRYYLYYVLDKVDVVSVAVCDKPAGKYEFYGYVHYEDGTYLGRREGDEPQFDPGVLTEGDKTYLFTGFCGVNDKSRHGSMLTVLGEDMLTIVKEPRIVVPGQMYAQGTQFEGHAFFEASSIRKRGDIYYFVYSSQVMHELCYAYSENIEGPYNYGGVIVSNSDIGIDIYKPADMPAGFGANNHGSIVEIKGKWYIFYHRQTNHTWYSRQGCAERIDFDKEGMIAQVEMTSTGLCEKNLSDEVEYPTYIACNLMQLNNPQIYLGAPDQPFIRQDGADGDKCLGYISNMSDGAVAGFKYFDFRNVRGVYVTMRGYAYGKLEIRQALDGEVVGEIILSSENEWRRYETTARLKDGKSPIYLKYVGDGTCSIGSIGFIH